LLAIQLALADGDPFAKPVMFCIGSFKPKASKNSFIAVADS